MKKAFLVILLTFFSNLSKAQVSDSFIVGGDIDKFYPVTFHDGGWVNNTPTNLTIGRSNVHSDSNWRGSLISTFNYHVSNYGHGSSFIKADIKPSFYSNYINFIAGWHDSTSSSNCLCIIIWLRGGGTTYYYQSNYPVNPTIYDGTQNPLPYNEVNGPAHSFKTIAEEYATTLGVYQERDSYFMAKVGIGTSIPDEKLTVKGKIHTQEVRVDMMGALVPDYVFANDYKLKSLEEVEKFIKENKHLPEIPSAQEIEKNGLMLAEMNMNLLKKMEEMTLYMIEMKKENEIIKKQNDLMKKNQRELEKRIIKIEKN